jgi:hypothetical protein
MRNGHGRFTNSNWKCGCAKDSLRKRDFRKGGGVGRELVIE